MISKICVGHSFYGSVRYICHELKKAEILAVEGVRGHDHKLMIQDFERQHSLRPEKKQACFHGILSFYPGEKPTDNTIVEIAGKYLDGLNIRNTQYAIVKHRDKAHLHVHLIANMVDNDGKSIADNWIALRAKKQAQKLTLEYKLEQGLSKKLSLTQYQNLREPEQYQYKIYAAIRQNLRTCRSLGELEQRLIPLGIEMSYKYKGQTKEKQGVSFRLGEYCFKGSQIDRRFSLGNLEKAVSLNQKQSLLRPYPEKPLVGFSGYANSNLEKSSGLAKTVTREMHKTLELLFTQEQAFEQIPYELSQEAKRKLQRQRQHLR
jgi:Relaxase/Mobilisation nuclease domain